MSASLSGSRYELHIARDGAAENKAAKSYFDLYPSDAVEEHISGDDGVGYMHSIEIGSTVDGPGLRFVLFLSGCPLRCLYCHNPDTWHKANGRPVTLNQIMKKIAKYEKVLRISKGGLTISGGEAVMQHDFTTQIFRRSKTLGIHTCLDTAGRQGERLSDAELNDIDLQILDIKSGDPETYERVTNNPLAPTLAYARRLSDLGRPMWVRFVLVPNLTDDFDNVEKVAEICSTLKSLERVEVLRFHQMGADKWKELGIDYPLQNTLPPSPALTERVRLQFRSRGLTVF